MAKVLLVTGGGRGIGHATAIGAARDGWDVCVNYLANAARAAETVRAVEATGQRAFAVQADVADAAAVERLFSACDKALGAPQGVVCSAGGSGPVGRVDAVRAADLATLWAHNVTSTFICAREAIRRMSRTHGGAGGSIVTVSSALARLGGGGALVPYSASKAAVETLTWGLAQEVAAEGVRVNCVAPGVIDTELQPPGRIEQIAPTIPLRRAGTAEEVAGTILWLLSDKASYVTGAVVTVSGGR